MVRLHLDGFSVFGSVFVVSNTRSVFTAVSQSVKEVLQSLVDDDMVNSDKCGNQTVYWCLPSEASQKVGYFLFEFFMRLLLCALVILIIFVFLFQRKAKLAAVKEDLSSGKKKLAGLKKTVAGLQVGREESDDRTQLLEKLQGLQGKVADIDSGLARFSDFDPESITKMKESTVAVKDSANRWTDNIFNCQTWASSKFNMERKDFGRQFEIPDDLDYLEASPKK